MANRLAGESSPYLQQHAENPVDWYPWGPEAHTAAREQDKPILLSVGYSACHWCHVMAHESFEDEDIAAKMNDAFINVKVDREERPDIDALYMEAVLALTGHGGWPMTVVMTPDGEPFFAGTYFPPRRLRGLPGFGDLVDGLAEAWQGERDTLLRQASDLSNELRRRAMTTAAEGLPARQAFLDAGLTLISDHDPINGGFGNAPKFPQPSALDVLFRYYVATGDLAALNVAELTLDHMAAGAMYDQLGGGFARYSVDATWTIPHFEKMLYDNAQLCIAYLHGWQVTGNERHLQIVTETIDYVLRDLRLESGGFASAEDADSEGAEGSFYVWSNQHMRDGLTVEEWAAASEWYGVTAEGNFEGRNALVRHSPTIAARPPLVESARAKLFALREQRGRPGLDDKVLTEWNALMIASLAEAGAAANRPDWVEAATTAMLFLEQHVRIERRWHRSWQQSSGPRHLAYAADYAALLDAYTRLGEATGEPRWHLAALETADSMIDLFWDDESGGVFTTGRDSEQLLVRRKELFDSPVPSANANAAFALLRLAVIHGRPDLRERSEDIFRLVSNGLRSQPIAHGRLLAALDLATGSTSEVVIAGDLPQLLTEVHSRYLPNTVVVHGEPFDSPLWEGRNDDKAYVCEGYACKLPTSDARQFSQQLDSLAIEP